MAWATDAEPRDRDGLAYEAYRALPPQYKLFYLFKRYRAGGKRKEVNPLRDRFVELLREKPSLQAEFLGVTLKNFRTNVSRAHRAYKKNLRALRQEGHLV